jgi:hypothetical protein
VNCIGSAWHMSGKSGNNKFGISELGIVEYSSPQLLSTVTMVWSMITNRVKL